MFRIGLNGWIMVYAAAVAAVLALVVMNEPRLYADLRDLARDGAQRMAPRPYDPSAPIAIVDIDEASLAEFGQWPWPRNLMAALTDRLLAHGAVAVGYDIVFPETDRTSPEEIAKSWQRFGGPNAPQVPAGVYPSHDDQFAAAIARGPVVLAVAGASTGAAPKLPAGVAVTGRWPDELARFAGALTNLPKFDRSAAGIGAISLSRNPDGVVRSVPMVVAMGDVLVPSLSAELLRVAQGAGGHVLRTSEASGEISGGRLAALSLKTGAADVPLAADGSFMVHFSGYRTERVVPVLDVMGGAAFDAALAAKIQNKIVLVGASAQGLFDIRATPLGSNVPGVTLHAEVLEQVLSNHYLRRPDWMPAAEALLVVIGALGVGFVLVRGSPLIALIIVLVFGGSAAAAGPYLFATQLLIFDPLAIVLAPILVFLPGAAAGLWAKERARRGIRDRFAHFVPADLLPLIEADPQRALTPQGAEKELTILFIDMRGFSTATEGMTPQNVVALVNTFLSEVSDVLVAHGATIDKYIGDAVMAFWNAPADQPGHAALALRALPAIRAASQRAGAQVQALGLGNISVGIGVNTGRAAIGFFGSRARLSYSCLGDSVNLSSRLEGLTQLYGVWNCVGPDTAAACPEGFVALPLDLISVKGFSRAVEVFTVVEAETSGIDAVAEVLARARAAYRARDWAGAEADFAALGQMSLPDCALSKLAALYQDRIALWRLKPPPEGWDGAHVAASK